MIRAKFLIIVTAICVAHTIHSVLKAGAFYITLIQASNESLNNSPFHATNIAFHIAIVPTVPTYALTRQSELSMSSAQFMTYKLMLSSTSPAPPAPPTTAAASATFAAPAMPAGLQGLQNPSCPRGSRSPHCSCCFHYSPFLGVSAV